CSARRPQPWNKCEPARPTKLPRRALLAARQLYLDCPPTLARVPPVSVALADASRRESTAMISIAIDAIPTDISVPPRRKRSVTTRRKRLAREIMAALRLAPPGTARPGPQA